MILETQDIEGDQGKISRGTFKVFENRDTLKGRMIELNVLVLHATSTEPRPDPIFRLAGGQGQAATSEIVPVFVRCTSFIETLRGMLHSTLRSRWVPLFIHQAFAEDFNPIANEAIRRNRELNHSLAMLQCVICAEDIARIDPQEIEKETKDTYFGDFRVRGQMAVCEFWPRSRLPENYGDPVSVSVPVLLLSGILDAVTPPRWGKEAASHLPNSMHIVAPGAHGVGGDCITGITTTFLNTGSVAGLDTSCVQDMRLPPFLLE